MKIFLKSVYKLSITTQVIAGLALVVMLIITLSEVILRSFGKPILGSYEIISFTGGIVIGFAIPYTSWKRGHIYVDFLINKFSKKKRKSNHDDYPMLRHTPVSLDQLESYIHGIRPVHEQRGQHDTETTILPDSLWYRY